MTVDHKHVIIGQLYEQLWVAGQQADETKKALEAANARAEALEATPAAD